ncbi:hypothetical protein [Rhizorhapis sp.]|uniref:hypothetical protein n=1 Tax=Rhizorhapis sp. TaxID=1968842 RepID=UPI002B4A69D4|nr:hypothetical protein [Rhizorhapis sp.]HKR16324.1 hypothetical protein [Rhizorhapis sp.]
MRRFIVPGLIVAAGLSLGACSTNDRTLRDTAVGAGVGAAGGAVAGAVIPGVSVGEGAAAGAVAGGVIGAVTSDGRRYYWDERGDCYYVKDDRRVYVDRKHCNP